MRFRRIRTITNNLTTEIDKLNKSEKRKLIGECQRLSETNCGWMMYGLKNIVIEITRSQLRWLKNREDLAKAKKEG